MSSNGGRGAVPRGYHDPKTVVPEQALWRAPLYFSLACWLTLLASWHEVAVRQVFAYLPGSEPIPGWPLACLAAALAGLGTLGARRVHAALASWFTAALLVCSLLVGASASLWFWSFARPFASYVQFGVLVACSTTLGFCLGASIRLLTPLYKQLHLLERALNPWLVLGCLVALVVAMGIAPAIGLLRTASVAAMLLALWAYWHLVLHGFVERRAVPGSGPFRALSLLLFAGHALWFWASERWISLDELRYFHNTIVYSQKSARSEFVVTSGSGGLQLFVNRALKLSDHDDDRYYESLAQPALALTRGQRRAAVLGVGDGMVTRQLLEHDDVMHVDLITLDARVAELARDMPWLVALNAGSLSSKRVTLVESDPYLWLSSARSRYDLVIVDLLDPTDYRQGKYYTTHFYELLAQRLRPAGVIAVQATSPFGSPQTFANVQATLRAAGLQTLPYRAAVPSLGEWGFVLASLERLDVPGQLPGDVRFLSGQALSAMFHFAGDIAPAPGPPSKLYDQRAVHLLNEERRRRK